MSSCEGRAGYETPKKTPVRSPSISVESERGASHFRLSKESNRLPAGQTRVFYIKSGKVKKTVVSEQGKEAVIALLGTAISLGKGA